MSKPIPPPLTWPDAAVETNWRRFWAAVVLTSDFESVGRPSEAARCSLDCSTMRRFGGRSADGRCLSPRRSSGSMPTCSTR